MKEKGKRLLVAGCILIAGFVIWTLLIQKVDVQPLGVNGTNIGFATINCWFHQLTGVHMEIYTITDWLGLVPIFICMIFGGIGCVQLMKGRSLFKVDYDIILLGIYKATASCLEKNLFGFIISLEVKSIMETKDIILELRNKAGLSQDELAEKIFVTRQAVSRWENGETTPNTDTLKLLSKLFDVSINTLLGSPRELICQCCGMPLKDDDIIGRDADGSPNEEYCKWCYADGTYTYSNMDDLINVCVGHMVTEEFSEEQAREYMKQLLPKLDYWKRYEELSDDGQFEAFKQQLINEINELSIEGMPKLEKLNALVGKLVYKKR